MDRVSESNPLVSVITPVYNSPNLQTTIDSVLAQNYEAIEFILVDDCSEHFCASEIYQYVQEKRGQNIKRFLLLQNDVNQGTVRTLNRGLKIASGKYFFQLAGDDEFADPKVIKDWVVAFQDRNSLVMTAKRANYDAQLKKCLGISPNKKQIQMIQQFSSKKLFEKLAAVNFIFGCCTAYDGTFMRSLGFYDTRYRLIEDHPMNLRLLRLGITIDFFDRVVVNYRGGGISSIEKFNTSYGKDSDRILKKEVIPYTKHPRRAIAQYQRWKRHQVQMKKHWQRQLEAQGKPLQIAFLKIYFSVTHPISTIKNILENPGKLKRLYGEDL